MSILLLRNRQVMVDFRDIAMFWSILYSIRKVIRFTDIRMVMRFRIHDDSPMDFTLSVVVYLRYVVQKWTVGIKLSVNFLLARTHQSQATANAQNNCYS